MSNGGIPYCEKDGKTFYVKQPAEERIADSLEKIVQLLDYQNKMLTNLVNDSRKRK